MASDNKRRGPPPEYKKYMGNEFVDSGNYSWIDYMPRAIDADVAKPFNLTVPISKKWDDSDFRLLIVVEKVDAGDLREKSLLSSQMGVVLTNLLRYTKEWAARISGNKRTPAVAAINFNCAKTYTIEDSNIRASVEERMAERVRKYVRKVDPTHVLIVGDHAASYLIGDQAKLYRFRRGTKHRIDYGKGFVIPTVTTIDISDTYGASFDDDEDNDNDSAIAQANILGYVSRNMLTHWLGKQPYSINKVKAKYEWVDTLSAVKDLINRMWDAKIVALDVEARNLNKLANKLITLQVAFDSKVGYVIPLWHADTPFTEKELIKIRRWIRDWLMAREEWDPEDPSYMIWHGGKYDLTQMRRDFGVPVIHRQVYDTMAGQHALDENVKALEKYGTPIGGLKNLCAHYNNTFYFEDSDFGKDDRANMDQVRFTNEDFKLYAAFDVQSVFAIHEQQLKEADHLLFGDRVGYRDEMLRLVLFQIGPSVHVFSQMEHRGVPLDVVHLAKMMLPNSPVNVALKEEEKIIYKSKAAISLNSKLVKASGVPTKGMFGAVSVWKFDVSKRDHLNKFFLDELKLKPVSYSPTTGEASFGKTFLAAYKEIPEVAAYSNLTKARKLKSSYINAFYNRMDEDPDGRIDGRLRPSYGFWGIVTGRSNSYDPSLQQIPQHNAYAKYIKRAFIAPEGGLIVKMDYSAHEIRCWGFSACDSALLSKFEVGRKLRIQYRQSPSDELKAEIKMRGDFHRLNAQTFFGVDPMDCSDEIRQAVKAIAFGAVYGKSVKSLARDTKTELKEMQRIYEAFFKSYPKAKQWLDWAVKTARTNLNVYSILGRTRRLYGYMTGVETLMAAMDRRAMNSPIQGLGSDIGLVSAYLYHLDYYDVLMELGEIDYDTEDLPNGIEAMVHDSSRQVTPYKYIPIVIQLTQWIFTQGAREYYNKYFGTRKHFSIPIECEFELGWADSAMSKWDWADASLKKVLRAAVEEQKKELELEHDVDEVMTEMWSIANTKTCKKLMKKYPFFPE